MSLRSSIDPTSSEFAHNAETMRALVADLREKLNDVAGGGGEASRKRHLSRGKMLARQRVDLLIDPGTAFLELSPLAAYGLLWRRRPFRRADLGRRRRVSGVANALRANDATIKGRHLFSR